MQLAKPVPLFLPGARAVLACQPMTFPAWARVVPPYAHGAVAMYWVIERICTIRS